MTAGPDADPHNRPHNLPHAGQPVGQVGPPLSRARLAVVMAHGRGGSAFDMLGLAGTIAVPDVAYLAPQAAGHSWWPQSFLAPLAANEPGLSSALEAVEACVETVLAAGLPAGRIVVMGFSQGACLALEHAARAGLPYRAVAALSGGLLGTHEAQGAPRDGLYGHAPKGFAYAGRLEDVPVLIGCHARDPHIPLERVNESAAVLEGMGARVAVQIYPGAGHGIVAEEIAWLRGVLNAQAGSPA